MLAAGQSVDNRYIVEGVIGVGGTAVVYRVRHKAFDTLHALKVLSVSSAPIRRRLVREGKVQNALRHPNLVAVTDIVPDVQGGPGLVMEYIPGPSLEQAMQQYKLSIEQALTLFHGIVAGVRFAHQHGAVHRDLKPANVLLERTEAGYVPKVTDFGLTKLLRGEGPSAGQTRQGSAMGTPAYMAPEQIDDAGQVDERADMFSLGCLLYELVTGQRAFPGEQAFPIYVAIRSGEYAPPRLHVPELSDALDTAIRGSLLVDREARIPDCDTLLQVVAGEREWDLHDADDVMLGAPLTSEVVQRTEEQESRPLMPVANRQRPGATPAPASSRSREPSLTYTDDGPVDGSLADADSLSEADSSLAPGTRRVLGWVLWGGAAAMMFGALVLGVVIWQAVGWLAASGALDPAPAPEPQVERPTPPEDSASTEGPDAAEEPEPTEAEPAPQESRRPERSASAPSTVVDEPGPSGPWPDPTPRPALTEPEPEAPEPSAAAPVVVKLFASPMTVDLHVDGRSQGRTPAKLELSPGQHRVRLTNGEEVHEFPIEVAAQGSNRWCYAFGTDQLYADVCPR